MKKIVVCVFLIVVFSIFTHANSKWELSNNPVMLGSCGATWGTVEDASQVGIGGVTIDLLKFNVLLNGWILDQSDVTNNGTGFFSFVIVNGCGTYRVRPRHEELPCVWDRKSYTHDYVDTSSVFGDQDFVCS